MRLRLSFPSFVRLSLLALVSALLTVTHYSHDVSATEEKFEFQAEVSRMMDIIINSLYQKKEVFLREVISNGADALDKIRFLSLRHPEELGPEDQPTHNLEMRISFDSDAKTLTIRDTGIGMTRQELIENLGTLAKSGTTNFIEQIAQTGDLSLIGQFGVGFYSVYLVADRVQVRSKSNKDDQQWIWESTADSTFTVREDLEAVEGSEHKLGRGTEIKLHLKEDALEYADQNRLESLVKKYSEFISFPIYLRKQETEVVEDEDDDEEAAEDDDDEDEDISDDDEEDEDEEQVKSKEKKKPKEVVTWNWVRLNDQAAIWTRSPGDVEPDEYKKFYKALTKEYEDPLTWTHFKAEGEVEFRAILFIPKRAPYNMYDNYYSSRSQLKLYVRKVLIKDDFEDLMPRYLNFIRGIVDSETLPLSVSRETLQQLKAVKVISKKLVRKALDLLNKMADAEKKKDEGKEEDEDEEVEEDDEEDTKDIASYTEFYKEFGKNIKLGLMEDSANKNKLAKLLRFKSTKSEEGETKDLISLDEYISRMPSWQKNIFYLTGDNIDAMLTSPFIAKAKEKGIEVLLLSDPIDEYVVQNLPEYENNKLQSLSKEGVKFGDETELEKKREENYKKLYKKLCKWLKDEVYNTDGQKVERVAISSTGVVATEPAIIKATQYGQSANMERIMKSQALSSEQARTGGSGKKIMELNPRSPIISKLNTLYDSEEEKDIEEAKDIAWLLYDTALVNSGYEIDNAKQFAARMYRLMQSGLSLESLEPEAWIEVPAEEPESEKDDTVAMDDDDAKEEL